MAKALDNLVVARQLKAEPSSPDEINTLLKRAAGLLADASQPSAIERMQCRNARVNMDAIPRSAG